MPEVDVVDGAAIRYDVTREMPFTAEDVLEKGLAAAGRLSGYAIVRAHHRVGAALADTGLEVGEIALAQIPLAHDGVERMAVCLRPAVHGVMLHRGNRLEVFRVVALEAANERQRDAPGQKRVFAVRLLSAAPPGIAKEIDVRRPDGESLIAIVLIVPEMLVMFRARLVRDDRGHAENETVVPRGREPDGLGEHRAESVACDAVQGFVPPVVGGNAQTVDRGRDILHLEDLLIQRHAPDEIVHALADGTRLVEICGTWSRGLLGVRGSDDPEGRQEHERKATAHGETRPCWSEGEVH